MNIEFISEGLTKLTEKLEGWGENIIKMIPNIILAILLVIIFWALSRRLYTIIRRLLKKAHFNQSLEQLLANVCRILVFTLGIILALAVLELQKTVFSMLAGVGIIGLALGFAFQDLAANFVAGIMLAVRSPIKIGDVIEIDGTMGTVIEIFLRETLVRNFSGQDVFIPNKDFTTSQFTNYSRFGKRRIKVEVGIGYGDDPEKGIAIVQKALESVDGSLPDPIPEAYVESLADSAVTISGYIWFKYPGGSFYRIQNDAIIKVKKALESAGFNIPFPIRTLDIQEDIKQFFEKPKNT